jgi:uncharacterized protein (DUF1697 family)
VGGHNVKMDRLRALCEELDFGNVETFIASGNVIFDASADGSQPDSSESEYAQTLERMIERHLHASLGYEVTTFIRSSAEVATIANYQPFSREELAAEGNTLFVAFLPGAPQDDAQEGLMALRNDVDDFHLHQSEAYWLRRHSVGESAFSGALLEKTMKTPATLRNANTVRRLAAKYAAPDPDSA